MTYHKSAKTHHYHIYPPSTISLEQLFSRWRTNPSHISWNVSEVLIIITTNKKSQEWKKMNDVRQKLVVKHWFLKQNMPVDFFLSNENFEKMSKWARKWDVFFVFIECLKAWFHAPVLPIISDFIEKFAFILLRKSTKILWKIRIYVLTKIS